MGLWALGANKRLDSALLLSDSDSSFPIGTPHTELCCSLAKMLPPGSASHPCDPEITSSPTPNETSEALNDMKPVVSEWLRLASMDRQSPDFLPLLSTLVKNDHTPTVKLQGNDARIVLSVLVEVRRLLDTERNHQVINGVVPIARFSGKVES